MTKIKKIERQETKLLVNESLTVLQKAMNKYGIEVGQANGARYGGDTMTVKIEFKVPALAEESAKKDYEMYMEMYGVEAPYGFEFNISGTTYRTIGLNHKAPKNRVQLKNVTTGATNSRCPASTVNSHYKWQTTTSIGKIGATA